MYILLWCNERDCNKAVYSLLFSFLYSHTSYQQKHESYWRKFITRNIFSAITWYQGNNVPFSDMRFLIQSLGRLSERKARIPQFLRIFQSTHHHLGTEGYVSWPLSHRLNRRACLKGGRRVPKNLPPASSSAIRMGKQL